MAAIRRSIVALLASASFALPAPAPDTAPAPDPLRATPEAMRWWQDARFGMLVCWGPVSLTGLEIGWSRGERRRTTGPARREAPPASQPPRGHPPPPRSPPPPSPGRRESATPAAQGLRIRALTQGTGSSFPIPCRGLHSTRLALGHRLENGYHDN